eukprot:CAMPEP_0202854138 /NCGR_PEP_ID=MMETSP1389-20130828/90844_1 /ASSEMBLY_ACC=CAM_ASM_000865 /TAXON_ID=302021 /ORGANISM="Rhodomonas sp., Strain CCMP768" /LENGTH=352 /DNA_ID=CAMNT_0049532713 /DNA_START=30 /DNA_END=1089 /DNA_ORIENTATION=-
MMRVKDPKKSLAFYQDLMGMTLIDKLEFPDMKFDLYFLTTLPKGQEYKFAPGSVEAHKYLWTMKGATLELTHNYGTEDDADFKYHPGNQEKDGFGHVAFNVNDVYATSDKLEAAGCSFKKKPDEGRMKGLAFVTVYATSDKLEAAGCSFKKKPDEGRMKGLAFVYDPDGYWVEIVKRSENAKIENDFNLSQTMLRIKDPKKSIPFYESLGMTVCREMHGGDFSLYFLACLPPGVTPPADKASPEASEFVKCLFNPVLELTHNHGTETQDDFKHWVGNEEGHKGFGHIGFLVDDVDAACKAFDDMGCDYAKRPEGGKMKGLAFVKDPDGYWLEIIKRGGYGATVDPYYLEPQA